MKSSSAPDIASTDMQDNPITPKATRKVGRPPKNCNLTKDINKQRSKQASAARNKGLRREREIAAWHRDQLGVAAERVPFSGSTRYKGNAADVDIYAFGVDYPPLHAEVKARADGHGFNVLDGWLAENDVLFLLRDRAEPCVYMPGRVWAEIMQYMKMAQQVSQSVHKIIPKNGAAALNDKNKNSAKAHQKSTYFRAAESHGLPRTQMPVLSETLLPAPLVKASAAQVHSTMPLDVVWLLDSELFALLSGEQFKAAFRLWCKAWCQQPQGSLPNDDRILAYLSGAGESWSQWREIVLQGFIACNDGRLYHPQLIKMAQRHQTQELNRKNNLPPPVSAPKPRRRILPIPSLRATPVTAEKINLSHNKCSLPRSWMTGQGPIKMSPNMSTNLSPRQNKD